MPNNVGKTRQVGKTQRRHAARYVWLQPGSEFNMLLDLVLRTTASSYPPRTILVDSRWDYLEPLVLRFLSQLHLQLCIYALFLLYLKESKPRGRDVVGGSDRVSLFQLPAVGDASPGDHVTGGFFPRCKQLGKRFRSAVCDVSPG